MPHCGKPSLCAILAIVAALSGGVRAADAGREVLSNVDVVSLVRAGVAPQLVMDKIAHTPNTFDMSTRAIIAMKENGVSDEVIRAMMAAAVGPAARPGLDSARFGREMENIVAGPPSARSAAVAWFLAHQAETLSEVRRALNDSRPEMRSAALLVIERAGDGQSIPAVRPLLTDGSPEVRADAARTLAALGDEQSVAGAEQAVAMQLNPLDGYARLLGYARRIQAAEPLGRVVSSNPDSRNRAAAAWALGEIGRAGVSGRPALEKALLDDADPEVRREAARAVAKYRDSAAAILLQDSCRTDPDVRRTTLEAMADYPESIEFLVGVLNLGPDQIAVDELETARAGLVALSGQDFGLDGQRWSGWLDANRSRFAVPSPGRGGAPGAASSASVPLSPLPGRASDRDVDVDKWGIVADSSGIPMAPMIDAMPSAASGPPPAPMFGGGPPSFSGMPGASGPSGTAAGIGPAGARAETPVPSDIPEIDPAGGVIVDGQASAPDQPLLKTWSSDPDRIPPPAASRAAAPSAESMSPPPASPSDWPDSPSPGGSSGAMPLPSGWAETPVPNVPPGWSEAPVVGDEEPKGWVEAPRPKPTPASPPPVPAASAGSGSMLPSAPVVVPPPRGGTPASAAPAGISLPLPGMASSPPDSGTAPAAPDAPPPAPVDMGGSSTSSFSPEMEGASLFAAPVLSDEPPAPSAVGETPLPFPVFAETPDRGDVDENDGFPESPDESFFAPPPGAAPDPDALDERVASPPPFAGMPDEEDGAETAPMPPAYPVTAAPSHAPSSTGPVFVEPEPGQVVVGDALFPGVPDEDASATTFEYRTETPTAPPVVAAPAGTRPFHPAAPAGTEGEEGEVISEEILVPDGFILGADGVLYEIVDDPSAVEGYVPPPAAAPPGPPRVPPSSAAPPPSAPPALPPPPAAPIAPPPVMSGDAFTDPSAPLPPVREEGTVRPAPGKAQPPMLGEGMF